MSDNNDMREAKDLAWKAFCEAPTSRDLGRSKVDAAVAAALEWQSQQEQGESAEPVAWVTADTVDGQTVNGKPRRIWWENNEGAGMPIYAAPVAVPEGWKLVPTEPTPDMTLHGALSGVSHAGGKFSQKGAEAVYKAMLAAFPQPSENDNQ